MMARGAFTSPAIWTGVPLGSTSLVIIRKSSLGSGALQFVKTRGASDQEHAVVKFSGRLALGCGRHDGTEERDLAHVQHRRADVVADRVHAGVVALAQRLVELVTRSRLGEVGLETHLRE